MAFGQPYGANIQPLFSETAGKRLRGAGPAAVGIRIKGQIDGSRTITQLLKLAPIEMDSQGAGDMVKARLPNYGVIEKAFHQDDFRTVPDLLPAIQASLGAWQKPMGRR